MTGTTARLLSVARILLVAAFVFPVYWMIVSSFAPEASLFEVPPLVPNQLTTDHYRALFDERQFWLPLRNSLIVSSATTALAIFAGTLAAYALTRLAFRGRTWLLAGVLAVSMLPQIALVPPLYLALRATHLINTYTGLVLPYLSFALPLSVWLLVGYFRQLPQDVEDAARIDGASRVRVLWHIVLPLAWPGVATAAILTFLFCWNEFIFARSFTLGPERQTAPVAIALFRGRYQVPWGQILAAAVVTTVPIAALVVAFERRIVEGLTAGAMKG
jgi:ABC-type glycerol-3-phosphate transport system permease component